MAFDLSFSPEFYYSEDPLTADKPYSVEMAIKAMSEADHKSLAATLGIVPEYLSVELIMKLVHRTNTCTTLTSPVDVWIDTGGFHTGAVHDAPRHIPDLDSSHAYPGYTPSLCGAETGEVVAWLDRDFVANCETCKTLLDSEVT